MIGFRQKGDFSKTTSFLKRARNAFDLRSLDEYGKQGVAALSSATPVDTGRTAASWGYEINKGNGYCEIVWTNSNIDGGFPVALMSHRHRCRRPRD